jgi:hypothetical protein
MQDFEPYFCTFEDCKAPFDVPNSFDGLLGHLRDHLPVRYHVDMPDGEHKEFDETEFKEHITKYSEISEEMLATMKEASRRKGAFLFESCPFCGGYPDVLEKRFPDLDTPEAQTELRKHIKQHMQDIALFLPPYREDIFNEDDDLMSSAVTRRRSINQNNSEVPDECKIVCNRPDCDCEDKGKYAAEDTLAVESTVETLAPDPEADQVADFWPELFGDSPLYDRSSAPDDYYFGDELLQPFIARLLSKTHTGGMVELGCWQEAERCDRVATQLLRIRGEITSESFEEITQLVVEVEATSRILRDIYDLFRLYRARTPIVTYYLTLVLGCLQKTLRDMMIYISNDELLSGRQWVLMNERLGDQGDISLIERFVL